MKMARQLLARIPFSLKVLAIRLFLLSSSVLLVNYFVFGDRAEYNRVKNMLVENGKISVLHHHDWSGQNEERSKIMCSWLGPFQSRNTYAYVECVDVFSGRLLFRTPSPALTYLWISDDSRYIVGLSDIKLDNWIQLVIFDNQGRLIKKRKIGSRESALTREEYSKFVYQFPSAAGSLMSRDRIVVDHNKIYIDYQFTSLSTVSREARDYLFKKLGDSHFSANISESVMNYIFWYKEDSPEIRLRYEGDELIAISLLDPKGQRFEVPINEEYCH